MLLYYFRDSILEFRQKTKPMPSLFSNPRHIFLFGSIDYIMTVNLKQI